MYNYEKIRNILSKYYQQNNREIIKILEQVRNNDITELNLNRKYVNNIDVLCEILKNNTSLKSLILSNNHINNIDKLGDYLKNNKTLKELNLSFNILNNINYFC